MLLQAVERKTTNGPALIPIIEIKFKFRIRIVTPEFPTSKTFPEGIKTKSMGFLCPSSFVFGWSCMCWSITAVPLCTLCTRCSSTGLTHVSAAVGPSFSIWYETSGRTRRPSRGKVVIFYILCKIRRKVVHTSSSSSSSVYTSEFSHFFYVQLVSKTLVPSVGRRHSSEGLNPPSNRLLFYSWLWDTAWLHNSWTCLQS